MESAEAARGVVGYNLPKWLSGINFKETGRSVAFEILDSQTGKIDVTLETEKLADLSNEVGLSSNSFTNVAHNRELSYGYAVSRQQSQSSSTDEQSVKPIPWPLKALPPQQSAASDSLFIDQPESVM